MGDPESLYRTLAFIDGDTQKEQISTRTKRRIYQNVNKNPSFKTVTIDGEERQLAIISQSNKDSRVKTVCSMPREEIFEGQVFEWKNSHWLISEVDIDSDVYMRGTAHWCNLLLRWQNEKGEIIERWCYTSVNTSDGKAIGTIINLTDGYYKVYLPLDNETKNLKINKRFLVDIDNTKPTAYEMTSRDVVTSIFDETHTHGIVIINIEKSEKADDRDNYELMIADYFVVKPDRTTGIKSSIEYGKSPDIKAGGSYKEFIAHFYDDTEEEVPIVPIWNVTVLDGYEDFFDIQMPDDGKLRIKAQDSTKIIGTQIKIELFGENSDAHSELYSKVVNIL